MSRSMWYVRLLFKVIECEHTTDPLRFGKIETARVAELEWALMNPGGKRGVGDEVCELDK